MARTGRSFHQLPSPVELVLRELGEAIRVGRLRRRQSAQDFASRLGVSLPTLRKLERGDPGVVVATFVTALWLLGLLDRLREFARPESDILGNLIDVTRLPKRIRKARRGEFDAL
jgi:transcriptional regulator with XRE-family HTH domain